MVGGSDLSEQTFSGKNFEQQYSFAGAIQDFDEIKDEELDDEPTSDSPTMSENTFTKVPLISQVKPNS